MRETVTLVQILTEVAPLMLSTLILAGALFAVLYVAIKFIVPALREMVEMFEAQRKSWKAILDEYTRINERLVGEAKADIERLEARVRELVALVADKDARIVALETKLDEQGKQLAAQEAEIKALREENERKDKLIAELREENGALRERLKALEEKGDEKSKTAPVSDK
jgi:septal ring factor EnvC (AmiA/AmiB activator)